MNTFKIPKWSLSIPLFSTHTTSSPRKRKKKEKKMGGHAEENQGR